MKLCKDCVYRKRNLFDLFAEMIGIFEDFSKCNAPQNLKVDPVTGRAKYRSWRFCETQRLEDSDDESCGIDANWFKPKSKQ